MLYIISVIGTMFFVLFIYFSLAVKLIDLIYGGLCQGWSYLV
uniref:Uncharacterized protein n=1 Tax=Anguilla anguilla TaxID=7936 RepID=A0A0E9XVU4_ANGAN